MSETEWMGVDLTKIPRGEPEFYPFPGQHFGDVMKKNGLEVMFGCTAGDIAIIYDYLSELGVKQVIFHDERAAGMASLDGSPVPIPTDIHPCYSPSANTCHENQPHSHQ